MSVQSVTPWSERISGGVVLVVGLAIAGEGLSYPLGTVNNMGPGFFPVMAGVIVALLGALIAWRTPDAGLSEEGGGLKWRPALFVFAGILAWALLLRPAGLVIATVALAVLSAFAYPKPNLRRIAITVVALPALGWLLFIVGLGMPMRAFPW